ncbi:hypothetical protein EFP18_16185 [Burkholderia glumae]|nr:hypothetical protein KS03_442 [Burkholderia glumae LMG 2196 = ATCC 33617]KHJ60248.1 hypothetical protein NCPPB3923_25095 [Burkholderia glumae]PNL00529.1 hypothetical protein CEQ24_015565 [Burkholderia glumae]QKM48275.1 hypothetical protein B7760_02309 [Burkholderia glumae]QKM52430.1 hypothetical protein CG017_00420 [Burkholderia glumae]
MPPACRSCASRSRWLAGGASAEQGVPAGNPGTDAGLTSDARGSLDVGSGTRLASCGRGIRPALTTQICDALLTPAKPMR